MTDPRIDASPDSLRLRRLATPKLGATEARAIRALLEEAFGDDEDERFTDDDWRHALGGTHVVLDVGGIVIAHASVVQRDLRVGGRTLRTGYVEAVAVAPASQGRGHGTLVMRDVREIVAEGFDLGALGTGAQQFYERLGWRVWQGPSFVRMAEGDRATPEDDGSIMVLATPHSPPLDLYAPITCDWREGDVW
jgi:aminoglycoside 2'-N-acetyltransferase I